MNWPKAFQLPPRNPNAAKAEHAMERGSRELRQSGVILDLLRPSVTGVDIGDSGEGESWRGMTGEADHRSDPN